MTGDVQAANDALSMWHWNVLGSFAVNEKSGVRTLDCSGGLVPKLGIGAVASIVQE